MARTTTKPRLSDLILDDKNANRGTKRGRALLNKSLKELGAGRSILIDKNRRVIAGNKTLEAAKAGGLKKLIEIDTDGDTIVAVRRIDLDLKKDKKAKELAIVDNRSGELNLEWDDSVLTELAKEFDLGALGFSDRELKGLGLEIADPETPDAKIDQAAELQKKWKTTRGQIWEIGKHRLMCGDSTSARDVGALMSGARVALMATDPPYLVEYHGGNHPRSLSNSEIVKDKHHADYEEQKDPEFYERFLSVALANALAEHVAIYQWHAHRRQSLVEKAWIACDLLVHQQVIWVKARAVLTHSHMMWKHEPCFYGWPNGKQPTRKPDTNATTVWELDSQNFKGIHPTEKPVEIFATPMRWHLREGEACYEPFSGSGSSLVAAQITERICYAMELAPAFVAVSLERLSEMGLKPKLVRK
jgi:DNA modification methylase